MIFRINSWAVWKNGKDSLITGLDQFTLMADGMFLLTR
jgi:hypothetical protein